MAKKSKRKKRALQVKEQYALGAPAFGQPALTVITPLRAPDMDLGFEQPGDNSADRCALHFLHRLMREHPDGVLGKAKADFMRDCREHLRAHNQFVSPRRLDRLWERTIDFTGAVAFRTPGPK